MNPITNLGPAQFGPDLLLDSFQSDKSSSSLSLKAARVTAATSLSKDITIETAQGDKVTISYENDAGFQAASYDALYQKSSLVNGENSDLMRRQSLQSQTDLFAYSQESQLSLSIEGDLNKQERQDIREALERIDKLMMETLQGGDLIQGARDATEIIALESVASVDADYRYQSLVTIEEMSQISSATNYGDSGALEKGDSGLKLPDRSSSSRDQMLELIDRMAEFIEDWAAEKKLRPEQFIRPLEKLFADHLVRLEDKPQTHFQQELFKELGQGLLAQIRNMSA